MRSRACPSPRRAPAAHRNPSATASPSACLRCACLRRCVMGLGRRRRRPSTAGLRPGVSQGWVTRTFARVPRCDRGTTATRMSGLGAQPRDVLKRRMAHLADARCVTACPTCRDACRRSVGWRPSRSARVSRGAGHATRLFRLPASCRLAGDGVPAVVRPMSSRSRSPHASVPGGGMPVAWVSIGLRRGAVWGRCRVQRHWDAS